MPYKSIFTVATPAEKRDAVETAIACARRWSAHLDVTCLTAAAVDVPAVVAPDMVFVPPAMGHREERALADLEAQTKKRLDGEVVGWSVSAPATHNSDLAYRIAQAQRFADLAVLAPSAADPSGLMQGVLEALLYNSRVPVLLAPNDGMARFENVIIGWDGSDVALAATRAALPILSDAASVEIAMVEPDSDTMGHDLAVMLDRHGIKAPVTALTRSGKRIADTLAEHARDTEADLMVMGAYGHRRMREIFIGGVTRNMLDAAPLPLFLAR